MRISSEDIRDKKIVLTKLIQELGSDAILQTNYVYRSKEKKYTFDLVELDSKKNNILKIYEIKTLSSVQLNLNFIKKLLQQYKRVISDAQIYLVYIDIEDQLKIIPLKNIDEISISNSTDTILVKSFSKFYEKLKQICYNENIDCQFFFRGHSDCSFKLIPGIFRSDNIDYEDCIYHEAVRREPAKFTEDMSTFDKLVKMQHYALPTRLLDITTNPLVALYFACKENEDKDGEVLIFSVMKEQIKYYDSDSVCIISNLAKQSKTFTFAKDKEYLVYDIQKDKPKFNGDYLHAEAINEVFCVLPKLNNERIIRQYGAFFIFGMRLSKKEPSKFIDEPMRIRIKASSKNDILKELNLLGINESILFPETDNIMKQITLTYIK